MYRKVEKTDNQMETKYPISSIPPFSCSIFREETVNALILNLPIVMAQQRFFAAGIAVADTPHTATGVIYAQIGNVT